MDKQRKSLPRYNIEYRDKKAIFSTDSHRFVTGLNSEKDLEEFYRLEYILNCISSRTTKKMDLEDAFRDSILFAGEKMARKYLEEVGIELDEDLERIFNEQLQKLKEDFVNDKELEEFYEERNREN